VEIAQDAALWQAWSPWELTRRLEAVAAPWAVAGGWALELFAGETWREHEDLEIVVPAARFDEVRVALGELEFWVPVGEETLEPFDRLPADGRSHQTWGLDPAAAAWRVDVMREPSQGGTWICRRDDAIRLPHRDLVERTPDGVPYVRPEVVLLFKAKHAREKDEEDVDVVAPRLEREQRAWLCDALRRVHPAHAWLARLGTDG
jgi:hypothetical protein